MVTAINAVNAISPAAAAAAAPAAAAGEPSAFARELDRAAQEGGANAEAGEEGQAAAPNGMAAMAGKARVKAKAAADAKSIERKPESKAAAHADPVTEIAAERSKDRSGADNSALPADLHALLAGMLAHAQTPPGAPAAAAAESKAARDDSTADKGVAAALPGQSQSQSQSQSQVQAQAQTLPAADAAAAAATGTLPTFSLPQSASAPAAAAAPAETAAPAPVHQAQVSAAVGTPEFAPGLSAEVNVMLRDGLQEARLQLNPADMGPITVQIQIDGSNAQINLSAEQAPTRDALEQALPSLAGTLRDNGLTLTGGGVFEQPRPPRDDNPPPSGSNRRGGGIVGRLGGLDGSARTLAPRGVVDLYA